MNCRSAVGLEVLDLLAQSAVDAAVRPSTGERPSARRRGHSAYRKSVTRTLRSRARFTLVPLGRLMPNDRVTRDTRRPRVGGRVQSAWLRRCGPTAVLVSSWSVLVPVDVCDAMSVPAFDSAPEDWSYLDHLLPQQVVEAVVRGVVSDLWRVVAEQSASDHSMSCLIPRDCRELANLRPAGRQHHK